MKIFTRTKNILSPLPRFGFWVTAVNLNNKRGVERVQTYANTIIDVDCVNQTGEAEKVLVMILCLELCIVHHSTAARPRHLVIIGSICSGSV